MSLSALVAEIVSDPLKSAAIVLNLIIIESLLSVDNAAVLATMVVQLDENKRNKALKYGILGAYVFRGLCLLFASFIIEIWWLKPLGGLYLLYLAGKYFFSPSQPATEQEPENEAKQTGITKNWGFLSPFWRTVVAVEIMDLAFSIDNIFAAVAFSNNIIIVMLGVFMGILAMRFVAGYFVSLLTKYPFLETSAHIVILILGLKLFLSVISVVSPENKFALMLENETVDQIMSVFTTLVFFIPILYTKLLSNKSLR